LHFNQLGINATRSAPRDALSRTRSVAVKAIPRSHAARPTVPIKHFP
jgi:hypothetical protein